MSDWTWLRNQLGDEFSYGPGHWFCVPHSDARRRDGSLFSEKGSGDGRRVVLADNFGPNATLYPRSVSKKNSFFHPAHAHGDDPGQCKLDKDAWVVLRVPVSVPEAVLCDATFSCVEPDGSALFAEIERAVSL